MVKQITKYLLVALVLTLGFGQLLRFEFFSVPLYLHDILVILLLATLLPRRLIAVKRTFLDRRPERSSSRDSEAGRRVLTGTTGIYVFLAGLALSSLRALTLYSPSQLLTPSLYALRLLAYLALYFILKNSKIIVSKLYFLLAGGLTLAIGLLQYFLLPDMRWAQYLGWDDHLSRLTLPHFDPTFMAVMLALALLSFVPKVYSSWLYTTGNLLTLFLTYSRSVWLSLAITFVFFIPKIKKLNYLVIGICLLVIPILFLPKKFGEGTNLLRTYSIDSRIQADWSYVTEYRFDLLLGRGLNTLILDLPFASRPNHATGPNNSYLYLLVTTGVLGLVGWGMFMFSLYTKSVHKHLLIFFFIASLFNNVMFYPFALLWVLLIEATVPTSA